MRRHDRERRARELFAAVLDRSGDDRERLLSEACGDDTVLRASVEQMLAFDESDSGFLNCPMTPSSTGLTAVELDRVGSDLGPFRIVRHLADGGTSTVYEAEQREPRRRVAVKVLRGLGGGSDAASRFRYEAEVQARLKHPGIVEVYAAGLYEEGHVARPWIAMELVEGARPLVDHAREARLSPDLLVELFLDLCDAIAFGHEKGVIHRDLKPSNVLVGVDGRLRVIDFGLARMAAAADDARSLMTREGAILGTVPYMSPEQFLGRPHEVGVRSDVYALGVILYELLCGRHPIDVAGCSLFEAAQKVKDEPPHPPRRARPDLARELEWIVLKALEKEPARRYAGARELAADLWRFKRQEPVLAGPPSSMYRLRKLVRRHRGLLTAVALVNIALVAGLVAAWLAKLDADEQRALAETRGTRLAVEVESLEEVNAFISRLLSAANPRYADDPNVRIADVLDRAARELEADAPGRPEVEASIRATLGESFLGIGRQREAMSHLVRAKDLLEAAGRRDVAYAAVIRSLAAAHRELGHLDKAEAHAGLYADLVAENDGSQAARDGAVIEQLYVVRDRGLAAQVEAQAQALLDRTPAVDGSVAHFARDLLVESLMRQGRLEEALPIAEAQVEAAGAAREHPRPKQMYAVIRVGGIHRQLDRPADARRWFERAVELSREVYGDDSPFVRWTEALLGTVIAELGEAAHGAELLQRYVDDRIRAGSGRGLSCLSMRNNLAVAWLDAGERDRARQVLDASLRDQDLGEAHSIRQDTRCLLADLCAGDGDWESALEHIEQVLTAVENDPTEQHAFSLNKLIDTFQRGQRSHGLGTGEAHLKRIAAAFRRFRETDHYDVLRIDVTTGIAAAFNGRFDEGRALLEDVVARAEARFGELSPLCQVYRDGLIDLCFQCEEWEAAAELLRGRVDRQLGVDPHSVLTVRLAYTLALALDRAGRTAEAEEVRTKLVTAWPRWGDPACSQAVQVSAEVSLPRFDPDWRAPRKQALMASCLAVATQDASALDMVVTWLSETAGITADDSRERIAADFDAAGAADAAAWVRTPTTTGTQNRD